MNGFSTLQTIGLWIVCTGALLLVAGAVGWLWDLSRDAYLGRELIRACGSREAAAKAITLLDEDTDEQFRRGMWAAHSQSTLRDFFEEKETRQ